MIRTAALACAALVALLPAAASAQSGAMWTDDKGRMMMLDFAGNVSGPPAPAAIEPAAMADLFKKVCVAGNARAAEVSAAATAQSLTAVPFSTGDKNPLIAAIWRGDGVVVSQADTFLSNKGPQCNATFYVAALPSKDALVAAVTAALGSAPVNADKATSKDGKPSKSWEPTWSISPAGGVPMTAIAHIAKGGRDMPGDRVQLSLLVASKKGA